MGFEDAGVGAGHINAGDQLIFYIVSPLAPDGTFASSLSLYASVPSYSADSTNHAYITSYNGTGLGNGIPAGTYVGLEDLPLHHSDFNYFDDTFVFTGVTAVSATSPEPPALRCSAPAYSASLEWFAGVSYYTMALLQESRCRAPGASSFFTHHDQALTPDGV